MPIGPGKYDKITTFVREHTEATAVIVIVFDGNNGSGFSMQTQIAVNPIRAAEALECVAVQIRESVGEDFAPRAEGLKR